MKPWELLFCYLHAILPPSCNFVTIWWKYTQAVVINSGMYISIRFSYVGGTASEYWWWCRYVMISCYNLCLRLPPPPPHKGPFCAQMSCWICNRIAVVLEFSRDEWSGFKTDWGFNLLIMTWTCSDDVISLGWFASLQVAYILKVETSDLVYQYMNKIWIYWWHTRDFNCAFLLKAI